MSNRQARREQARTSRSSRPTRPAPGGSRRPSGSSSNSGSSIFSPGFMLALVGFVIAGIVVVVLVVMFGGDDDEASELASNIEQSTAELPLDLANGTKLGRDDAPVKITAFEDFQCPFCLQYTANQEPAIVNELVKTGKVQLEFRHLPILKNESVAAAMASQCAADQDKFWQYHHLLFLTQAKAGQVPDERLNVGRFSDEKLKQFATDVGLERTAFDQCLDTREHLDLVTEHQRQANEFGITGTPGFLVNGQPLGTGTPSSIEQWKQIVADVEKAIATATANANTTPTASASPSAVATATATRAP